MGIVIIVMQALSGLLLTFVGASRLSNPIKTFSKSSGIELPEEVNVLNEARGISAVQLLAGLLLLMGTFVDALTAHALVVGTLLFLGFAVGRLISQRADGKPNPKLIQGLGFELVFGAANAFCLLQVVL